MTLFLRANGKVRTTAVIWGIALVALACASPRSSPGGEPGGVAPRPEVRPSRVTIANGIDPKSLASKLDEGGTFSKDHLYIPNSPLVLLEPERGAAQPLLAAELPSRDRGTWRVNADGTMATVWRIRPNALWHDGEAVTARDFVLAFRVYMDEAIAVQTREPERLFDRVEAVDEKTFSIVWKQPFPWADQLLLGQMEPLPQHLLGALYDAGDRTAFENAAFWSTAAYVGTGPYRIVDWEKGVQLTYRAFDRYFMGKPAIEEVAVRIIPDINTAVANVLSGAVDVTVSRLLNVQARLAVKEHWDRTGEGRVASNPTHLRHVQIQLEPNRTGQPALLDVRVRRAIAHAADREAIAEAIFAGASSAREVMITPDDPLFPRVDSAISKYPYDRARALALLQDAGWTRRGDSLVNAAEQLLSVDITTPLVADNETEMSLLGADLALLGMQVTQTTIPQARMRDREYRASFPGLLITATDIDVPRGMVVFTSGACPTRANQFVGNNRGCWTNAEYERFFQIATTSLDEEERANGTVGLFRVISQDVGVLGMSYHVDNIAVRKGLIGPGPRWPSQSGHTWNIHEWRWEQ